VPFHCRQCHKVGYIFKDCPLNNKIEDIPKPSSTPSRIDLPAIHHSLAPGPIPSVNNPPPKVVDEDHRTLSSPFTGSWAAAEAAKASGTHLTPLTSGIVICSSFVAPSIFVAHCTMVSSPVIAPSTPSLHSLSTSSSSPSSPRVSFSVMMSTGSISRSLHRASFLEH